MDMEVDEWTRQGVQRNGSYTMTLGKRWAPWESSQAEDALGCTLFPSVHKVWLIFVTKTSGWRGKNSNCKKIGRHKHPYDLEFSWGEE